MAGNEDRSDQLEDTNQSDIQSRDDLVQTVLDSLTHPFYVIDVATRRIRLANRAARAIHTAGSICLA